MTTVESLMEKLKELRLKAFAAHLEQTLEIARQKNWSIIQAVEHLADLELELRKETRKALCLRQAKLATTPNHRSV